MKKRMKLLLLLVALIIAVTGCGNDSKKDKPSVQYENMEYDGPFDIEEARKNIIIKGQPFEIPIKLGDLPSGWTYQEHKYSKNLDPGHGIVTLFFDGVDMVDVALEEYDPEKPKKAIIYNFTIHTADCSIDGFMPQVSTKDEVVGKYGEPYTRLGGDYYGIVNDSKTLGGRINNQSISFKYNDDGTISSISLTYADLSK